MSRFPGPGWFGLILYFLIAIILIIVAGIVIHALGGFSWDVHIGHFHLLIAVT